MSLLNTDEPLIPAKTKLPELTLKVFIFSILLAVILAAADAYLALKIGSTIAASIPASVLAIGLLRFFKRSNVLESNIIQTAASAGEGIAAAVAFVLPGMILLGVWKGFPYWETASIIVVGGLLGVLFSVPLRRVMLSMPALRFPEGTAIGNVLRTSTQKGAHLKMLVQGSAVGGLVGFVQTGFHIVSDNVQLWFTTGKTVFGFALGFSPAPLAAGYIIGIEVGVSLFVGFILGWVIVLPILGLTYGVPDANSTYDAVMSIWSKNLRFVGVGTMLVGGVWTLLTLIKPIIKGLKLSFRSLKTAEGLPTQIPRTERDIPMIWVFSGTILLSLLLYMLVMHFVIDARIINGDSFIMFIVLCTVVYLLVIGFLLATICAYFTGLVGSTNNPLSGILILSVLILGLIYWLLFDLGGSTQTGNVAALMIIVITIVACIAAISNENLQDLKAGQMVGATPWKQQLMLGVGVIASALVVGPVLELLFNAYGMAGVFPRSGMDPSQMLPAPQAGLITAVVQGIREHHLNWNMIYIGAGLGVGIILVDEVVKRKKGYRLPSLAVGLGIYLPPSIILPISLGGFVNYLVKRQSKNSRSKKQAEIEHEKQQRGILLACGLVAGSALMGVVLAIPFVIMGTSDALAVVGKGFKPFAEILGVFSTVFLCYWLYAVTKKR